MNGISELLAGLTDIQWGTIAVFILSPGIAYAGLELLDWLGWLDSNDDDDDDW